MMFDDIYTNKAIARDEMSHKLSNETTNEIGDTKLAKALFFYKNGEPYITGEQGIVYEVNGFFMTKYDGTVKKDKVIFYGDFDRGLKKVQELFPEYLV